jgi:hypothetical protein
VVGLGLRKHTECPIEVNLLPKSARRREQMQQQRPYLAGAAACALLILLCWLGYTHKTVGLKTAQLQELSDKVNKLNELSQRLSREQNRLSELQGKASQIVSLVDQRSLWPELLQDLSARLGSNIWIVSFTPDSGVPNAAAAPAAVARPRVLAHSDRVDDRVAERLQEDNTPPPTASSAPAAGRPGKNITEIRVEGAGIHSADNPEQDIQLVDDFAKNLRSSSFYDKTGVVIDVPPNPTLQGKTFTFTIRAKLLKPISM